MNKNIEDFIQTLTECIENREVTEVDKWNIRSSLECLIFQVREDLLKEIGDTE